MSFAARLPHPGPLCWIVLLRRGETPIPSSPFVSCVLTMSADSLGIDVMPCFSRSSLRLNVESSKTALILRIGPATGIGGSLRPGDGRCRENGEGMAPISPFGAWGRDGVMGGASDDTRLA